MDALSYGGLLLFYEISGAMVPKKSHTRCTFGRIPRVFVTKCDRLTPSCPKSDTLDLFPNHRELTRWHWRGSGTFSIDAYLREETTTTQRALI
jgi:hypothetical protein